MSLLENIERKAQMLPAIFVSPTMERLQVEMEQRSRNLQVSEVERIFSPVVKGSLIGVILGAGVLYIAKKYGLNDSPMNLFFYLAPSITNVLSGLYETCLLAPSLNRKETV
ncbi:hypothetical protein KW787_03935 [Candidatus Pacearchaeota archaeon]|nr:hypothetical protein [Candidatus Pacearchaeota archaeon]